MTMSVDEFRTQYSTSFRANNTVTLSFIKIIVAITKQRRELEISSIRHNIYSMYVCGTVA